MAIIQNQIEDGGICFHHSTKFDQTRLQSRDICFRTRDDIMHARHPVRWFRIGTVKIETHFHQPVQGISALVQEPTAHFGVVTGFDLRRGKQTSIFSVIIKGIFNTSISLHPGSVCGQRANSDSSRAT